jgi:hypothetical protein
MCFLRARPLPFIVVCCQIGPTISLQSEGLSDHVRQTQLSRVVIGPRSPNDPTGHGCSPTESNDDVLAIR